VESAGVLGTFASSGEIPPQGPRVMSRAGCGMSHGDRGELGSSMCEAAMSGGTKEGDKRGFK
jgi:hypothetical protein